jgi:hypothetical protein
MKKRTKRLVGAVALAAGAVAGIGVMVLKRKKRSDRKQRAPADVWARPGMAVTFRAELMPGRSASERTFYVAKLLPSGRVTLQGFAGEHTESAFEPLR